MAKNVIAVVNGPNLNLLGKREPGIYGTESMEHCLERLERRLPQAKIEYYQTNSEGGLIDIVQELGYRGDVAGIVLNPGAYAHYSYALADAVGAVPTPVVEVHISNIHAREEWRQKSVTASACRGMICGLGLEGYELAALSLLPD